VTSVDAVEHTDPVAEHTASVLQAHEALPAVPVHDCRLPAHAEGVP
jgi:hypothetical protein